MNGKTSDRVQFGPYEADLHTHELWKFGRRIKLVGQPFEILAILLSKPGELVTREELRDRLWSGDTYVDFNHGLNAAVNRLREALCDSAEAPKYVETLPRRGYRFIAEVGEQNSIQPVPELPAPELETRPVPEIRPVAEHGPEVDMPATDRLVAQPVANPSPWIPPVQTLDGAAEMPIMVSVKAGGRRLVASGVLFLVLVLAVAFGLLVTKKVRSRAEAGDTSAPVQPIRPLTTLTDETNEPAFSPDGHNVAFRRESAKPENSGIFVKGIDSDQLIQLTSNRGDGFPVWSPDGQLIAFSRSANREEFEIYLVPLARGQARLLFKKDEIVTVTLGGAEERKLDTAGVPPARGELDWSPDGKTIAFASGASIFLLSLETHAVRRLTEPPPISEDWGPAFSPDGQRLLFVRSSRGASPDEIMAIPTSGGEATQITTDQAGILSPPRWSLDSRSVIFASSRASHPGLWRTGVDARESPVEINDGGFYPTISRRGYRMAYQRAARGLNIWEMDLSSRGNQQHILVPSTSQTDQGPGPQFSPDGKKLVYMSDRSGTMEIWVSDRDGSNPVQLTALGGTGTPRWSPDSQSIAFDRKGAIYVVSVQGGAPRLIAPDNLENDCPSWSPDGKWVYFASARTHDFQVWKAPAEGGSPVQVTARGGHAALASPDGKYVYYAKSQYANPEIWQVGQLVGG